MYILYLKKLKVSLSCIFYSARSLKQQSVDRHVAPHYPDSETTSLGSFSLMLRA